MSKTSERRTSQWDIHAAPRNYTMVVLSQGGGAIASFASIWLLTRFLGPNGYGAVVAIVAASWMAQVLINWSAMAVVRFGVDEFVAQGIIATIFWLRLLVLLVNAAIVLLLAPLWFPWAASWLHLPPGTYPYVAGHFVVMGLWIHVQHGLQAAKLPRAQGVLLMMERVAVLGALLVLALREAITVRGAVICYIGAAAFMTMAGAYRLRDVIFHRWTFRWPLLRTMSSFAIPLLPFSIVGFLSGSYLDAAFVTRLLGTRNLGFYSIGTQISGVALQLPTLANTLLLPLFVTLQIEAQQDRLRRLLGDLLPSLTLVWGVGATGAAFVGTFAIPLFFGAEFAASVTPLWILLAATTLTLPVLAGYSSLSNAQSRTWVAMLSAMLAAIANISLNNLLIPRWGMAGCAWATMVAYFAGVTVFATCLREAGDVSLASIGSAMLPAIAGAALYTSTANPLMSLSITVAMSAVIAKVQWQRLRRTVRVFRSLL